MMVAIIERIEELTNLIAPSGRVYVSIVRADDRVSVRQYPPLGVFMVDISTDEAYYINMAHEDVLRIDYEQVYALIRSFGEIFTPNLIELWHIFPGIDGTDLRFIDTILLAKELYMLNGNPDGAFYLPQNEIQPILRLIDPQIVRYRAMRPFLRRPITRSQFHHVTTLPAYYELEKMGWLVDAERFRSIQHRNFPTIFVENGTFFPEYNLKMGDRPGLNLAGVHFYGLPVEKRSFLVPRNDYFLEIDYRTFSYYLLCKFVFEIEEIPSLSAIYIAGEEDSGTIASSELKRMWYEFIFNVSDNEHISNFDEIIRKKRDEAIDNWSKTMQYCSRISGKKYFLHEKRTMLSDVYRILESEYTALKMRQLQLLFLVNNSTTQLIHYHFDAFLFDVSTNESGIVEECRKILTADGFPISIKHGTTYPLLEHGL